MLNLVWVPPDRTLIPEAKMVEAPQVTRWVGGHRELAGSQPLSHFWEDRQDLSCRMLDLKWTGSVCSCVCGFLLLSHVGGLFLP